jgi:hypothetical protein
MQDDYVHSLQKENYFLKEELKKVKKERCEYLSNWIAAQEISSVIQIKMLLNKG